MKTTDKSTIIQVNKKENKELPLEDKIALLTQEKEELTAKLNWYEEQFRLSQQKRFGASSEKSNSNYISLFNEAEDEAQTKQKEPLLEEITYKRRKGKNKKKNSFDDLPVEVIEYHLDQSEQLCPQCGNKLHVMSKEIRKELKVIPAQVKVVEHVRDVYACRN